MRWVDRRAGRPPPPLRPDGPRASLAGPRLQGRARWVPQAWTHSRHVGSSLAPGSPEGAPELPGARPRRGRGLSPPPHQALHLRPAAPEQQWSRVCPAWTLGQSRARDTGSSTSSSALCPRCTVSHCPSSRGPVRGSEPSGHLLCVRLLQPGVKSLPFSSAKPLLHWSLLGGLGHRWGHVGEKTGVGRFRKKKRGGILRGPLCFKLGVPPKGISMNNPQNSGREPCLWVCPRPGHLDSLQKILPSKLHL